MHDSKNLDLRWFDLSACLPVCLISCQKQSQETCHTGLTLRERGDEIRVGGEIPFPRPIEHVSGSLTDGSSSGLPLYICSLLAPSGHLEASGRDMLWVGGWVEGEVDGGGGQVLWPVLQVKEIQLATSGTHDSC